MPARHDVLHNLPTLSFRGIEVPCVSIDYGFAHDSAEHKFIFRDEALLESLGRTNQTFRYLVPFREGIARGPYRNLFLSTYQEFINACRDREPGILEDPVLGAFRVKCASLSSTIDATKRDGADVQVDFVQAPFESDIVDQIETTLSLMGAISDAGAFDEMAAQVDWEQELPPEPLTDPLSALTGIADQGNLLLNQVAAKIDDAAFRINRLQESYYRLGNVSNWAVFRSSQRMKAALDRAARNLGATNGRIVRTTRTRQEASLSALAVSFNMAPAEFVRLNPRLSRSPTVPPNTQVRYFASA